MLFKAVFLLFVLNIFEVKPEEYENEHHEFVSAVLKKNKSDPNRFTFAGKHYYVANIFTVSQRFILIFKLHKIKGWP